MGLTFIGTLLPLFIFLTGSECSRFIGCYKENSVAARLMNGDSKNFIDTLTPDVCISYCKSKGFKYAGLQYSFECYCSNERPSFKDSAEPDDCGTKCAGDPSKVCGGNLRLSVYDIQNKPINYVQTNYVGCFSDSSDTSRALVDKKGPDSNEMTPEYCVSYCYRHGYRFAGVQYKFQCFCGDEIKGQKQSEGDCDMECKGDSRFLCGGHWRNNIYHTSISDESEEGRLIGCFVDSNNLRLLSGYRILLPETNSPRKCFNICLQLGYTYAGVEFGEECYCGNKNPDREKEARENECQQACPGGKVRMCGGSGRILIYTTSQPVIQPAIISVPGVGNQPAAVITRPSSIGGSKPTTLILQPSPQLVQPVTTTVRTTTRRPTTSSQSEHCRKSLTFVSGKAACMGEILFQEEFKGNSLDLDKWKYEIFMPDAPDFEFVVFDENPQTSFVRNGVLTIKPDVFDDEFVRRGRLHLERCTGRPHSEECSREGKAYNLLPPVQSARITTKDSFNFKYGKIQIGARLPVGDWLTPEIWLEPKLREYGPSYTSGRIRLAFSPGNRVLTLRGEDIGSRRLESSILMGTDTKVRGRKIIRVRDDGWYNEFHNYTLIWTPDNLSFWVDGKDQESLVPRDGGKMYELVGFDYQSSTVWQSGTSLAPFDKEFYVSIGLSVGGMREYPDNSVSNGHEKPWKNMAVKALVDFWKDRSNWQATWNDPKSSLQISHVVVQAL